MTISREFQITSKARMWVALKKIFEISRPTQEALFARFKLRAKFTYYDHTFITYLETVFAAHLKTITNTEHRKVVERTLQEAAPKIIDALVEQPEVAEEIKRLWETTTKKGEQRPTA